MNTQNNPESASKPSSQSQVKGAFTTASNAVSGAVSDAADAPQPLCGVLVVDKPIGWSSMDVIRRIRRSTGQRKLKAGHAGTLDPLATGVLVCCIGKATKLAEKLMGQSKVYEAQVDLSAFTTTDDKEGARDEVAIDEPPTREAVEEALKQFVGDIDQTPPAFSAIHVNGKRAYDLARAGKEVKIASRIVKVYEAALLDYHWPVATVTIHCGKGTYIRSIARDLGKVLGTGGHLASLRRTVSGQFEVTIAMPGKVLEERELKQVDLLPIDQLVFADDSQGDEMQDQDAQDQDA